ncbi:hypothetical protein [Candidatus Solirubrobacter pratensis]|uniref:hypothetical protein n=1 Tax=Candidatus Solirubrobacter pratensis TaxID=1298857 RepID=UPI0003F9E302|nr:hypothetical protein [Candidatus Solirubrobacter pratensis]
MAEPAQVLDGARFDPAAYSVFRFTGRSLDPSGAVSLRYALDDEIEFEERFELPPVPGADLDAVEPLLALLHWTAGVSYYKTAAPARVALETGAPGPATSALLEALYSEGLGEFAATNRIPLPRPAFAAGDAQRAEAGESALRRVLVPVGGGKDSAVALEIVRRSGLDTALVSVGNAKPIERTVEVAGLPRLLVRRHLDPGIGALNARGALNGHVPVTAIVSSVALLTAALHGYDAVALANERSASAGNTTWDGVEVNHQFSKGLRAERLLRAAAAEAAGVRIFSVLRPAAELAIARAFARLPEYHPAFTSCNRIFRLDPALRASSWCCDCDKCRFVFLILAPFMEPAALERIFGKAMLEDEAQYTGFALLTATGGHKPFECVGEVEESVAAIRMLAADPRWRSQRVVRRLVDEVLPLFGDADGLPAPVLALSDDHEVPRELLGQVDALLGA